MLSLTLVYFFWSPTWMQTTGSILRPASCRASIMVRHTWKSCAFRADSTTVPFRSAFSLEWKENGKVQMTDIIVTPQEIKLNSPLQTLDVIAQYSLCNIILYSVLPHFSNSTRHNTTCRLFFLLRLDRNWYRKLFVKAEQIRLAHITF